MVKILFEYYKEYKKNIILIGILILSTVLRFYRISSQSIWFDEAISFAYAELPFLDIISVVISDTQAPLYFLFLHFWMILGKSEFILRSSSAIFGIASTFLIYLLGKEIFNKRVGLIASFLISISPFTIYYSQELRVY